MAPTAGAFRDGTADGRTVVAMSLRILDGTDVAAITAIRDELTAAWDGQFERIMLDGGLAELAIATATPSLFGGPRRFDLTGVESIPAKQFPDLLALFVDVDGVARGDKPLTPTQRRAAGPCVEIFDLPRGRAALHAVRGLAAAAGISLDRTCLARLGEVYPTSPWRVRDIIGQLELLGAARPSQRVVETLIGSAAGTVPPWDVTDAIESGDVARALAVLDAGGWADGTQDVFGLIGWIRTRMLTMVAALDEIEAGTDPLVALATTGIKRNQAESAVRVVRRLTAADSAALVAACRTLERDVRTTGTDPAGAVEFAVATLASLFSAQRLRA